MIDAMRDDPSDEQGTSRGPSDVRVEAEEEMRPATESDDTSLRYTPNLRFEEGVPPYKKGHYTDQDQK